MVFCPNCGSTLPEEAKFCMACGKSVPTLENLHPVQTQPSTNTPTIETRKIVVEPSPEQHSDSLMPPVSKRKGRKKLIIVAAVGAIVVVLLAVTIFWGLNANAAEERPILADASHLILQEEELNGGWTTRVNPGGNSSGPYSYTDIHSLAVNTFVKGDQTTPDVLLIIGTYKSSDSISDAREEYNQTLIDDISRGMVIIGTPDIGDDAVIYAVNSSIANDRVYFATSPGTESYSGEFIRFIEKNVECSMFLIHKDGYSINYSMLTDIANQQLEKINGWG